MFLSAYLAKSVIRGVTGRAVKSVTGGVTNSTTKSATGAAAAPRVDHEKFEAIISQLKELESLKKQSKLLQFKLQEHLEYQKRLKEISEWLKDQK